MFEVGRINIQADLAQYPTDKRSGEPRIDIIFARTERDRPC